MNLLEKLKQTEHPQIGDFNINILRNALCDLFYSRISTDPQKRIQIAISTQKYNQYLVFEKNCKMVGRLRKSNFTYPTLGDWYLDIFTYKH